jgi:hypothetical protein
MPEDATFELGRIKGATGRISLEAVDSEGRPISNMRAWMVYIDEKLTATSIQLGAADGPWKTRARDSSRGGKSTAGIVFSKAYESDEGVRIIVADEHLDLDYRIAAIDTQGKEHVFHQRGGSAGKVRQTTALFHDIKLNQIEYFLFQTRPYQWVTFKDVSLQPGVKTDVQVGGKEIGKKNGSKWISHSAETNKSPGAQRQIVIEARVFSIKTPNTSIPNYLYSKLGIKNVNTETPLMIPVQLTNEQAGEFEKWAAAIPGTTTLVSPKVTAVNGELVDLTLTTQHERIMSYKKPENSSGKPEPVFEKLTTGVKLGITPEFQRDENTIVLKLAFSKNDLVGLKKDLNESVYEIELPKLTTVSLSTNILVASGKYTLVPVAGLFSAGKIEAGGKQIHQTFLLVKPTILNLASGLQDKPAGQVQGEGGAPKQLSSGGGYQNLSREQRERLERRNDHKGRCPSNLSDLRKYIADEQIFDWINRNVVYLGKNQQYGAPPDAVLAYDESMLKKPRQETNVLYNDAHVSFEKSEWLKLKATSHQPGQKTDVQVESRVLKRTN